MTLPKFEDRVVMHLSEFRREGEVFCAEITMVRSGTRLLHILPVYAPGTWSPDSPDVGRLIFGIVQERVNAAWQMYMFNHKRAAGMRIISLTQPFATLMAISAKRNETRSWFTRYRGPLAIHAAKGLGPVGGHEGFVRLCLTEPFHSVLSEHMQTLEIKTLNSYLDEFPMGAIVCVVDLAECKSTNGEYGALPAPWIKRLSEQEKAFGNYEPNRFAWFTEDLQRLREPLPYKGAQGLRDLPPEIELKVRERL